PPQDGAAFGRGMQAALRDLGTPAMDDRLRHGRERVQRLYSLTAMVSAYEANWRRLAARNGAQRPAPAAMSSPGQEPGAEPGAGARGQSASGRQRLLYVVNNPAFFLSHRLPIALAARDAGYDAHVATMAGAASADIVAHGLHHHEIPMSRGGKNPLQECATLFALWRLYRSLRPDVVHAVTIKPVLYGGIAARLAGVPSYVARSEEHTSELQSRE